MMALQIFVRQLKKVNMAKTKQRRISSILFERIRGEIPTAERLVAQAVEAKIGRRNDAATYIRENFSSLIEDLQLDAYKLYLASEEASAARIIRTTVEERLPDGGGVEDALNIIAASFGELDKFFLSLTQSRRARAGTAFQEIMSILLRKLDYPFVAQPILDDSKPDYVMPSWDWYKHNATDCIILTLKRTLRERWRQVPTEGNSGSTFFLATIDDNVPGTELDKMKQLNVRMVVPTRLKEHKYAKYPAVISFEYFFEHFMEPAMNRWKVGGAF
jgi:EcoRII C terminal